MTTIVFDLGGVLSTPEGKVAGMAELMGVDATLLDAAYWAPRAEYDAGCSNLAYWSAVGEQVGMSVDEELADRLSHADAEGWARIRPEAVQILADLAEAGVKTAILSNAPTDMYEAIDAAAWRQHVGPLFVSGVLEAVKPDAEIYDHVAQTLAVDPAELYFIDDSPANVAGAQAQGWHAHLWRDDADTRAWLVELGVL